jgi:hypothetical protein
MTPPEEIGAYTPGIVGAVGAAAIALKEGWRPFLLKLALGLGCVFGLSEWATLLGAKVSIPQTASGFILGFLCVQIFDKVSSEIQKLEIARPINGLLERWTGSAAPKGDQP